MAGPAWGQLGPAEGSVTHRVHVLWAREHNHKKLVVHV